MLWCILVDIIDFIGQNFEKNIIFPHCHFIPISDLYLKSTLMGQLTRLIATTMYEMSLPKDLPNSLQGTIQKVRHCSFLSF